MKGLQNYQTAYFLFKMSEKLSNEAIKKFKITILSPTAPDWFLSQVPNWFLISLIRLYGDYLIMSVHIIITMGPCKIGRRGVW